MYRYAGKQVKSQVAKFYLNFMDTLIQAGERDCGLSCTFIVEVPQRADFH